MKGRGIYSEAQWKWVAKKYREGYMVTQLAEFLHCHRQTVTNHLRQMLAMPRGAGLPDLSEYADEFAGLGASPERAQEER